YGICVDTCRSGLLGLDVVGWQVLDRAQRRLDDARLVRETAIQLRVFWAFAHPVSGCPLKHRRNMSNILGREDDRDDLRILGCLVIQFWVRMAPSQVAPSPIPGSSCPQNRLLYVWVHTTSTNSAQLIWSSIHRGQPCSGSSTYASIEHSMPSRRSLS